MPCDESVPSAPSVGDGQAPASAPEPRADPAKGAPSVPREAELPPEHGGPEGLEPTRYGDWERRGRCIDF
jgi:hypothetical protein